MLELQTLIDDYAKVCKGSLKSLGLRQAYSVACDVKVNQTLNTQELEALLPDLAKAQGWLQFTDRNVVLPSSESTTGRLLEAEYVIDEVCFRLKYCGHNQWQWHGIQVSPTEQASAYLAIDVQHSLDGYQNGSLHYRNIWQLSPEKGLQVITSVLTKVVLGEQA